MMFFTSLAYTRNRGVILTCIEVSDKRRFVGDCFTFSKGFDDFFFDILEGFSDFALRGKVKDVVYFPNCFHLHDRVGKPRIGHDERSKTSRLPAIVELCIQAGLDLKCYPTKRRRNPVYSVEGRIVDFEEAEIDQDPLLEHFHPISQSNGQDGKNLGDLSTETLKSWLEMRSGAKKIMEKYNVQTCGYCPEVQVGPKGHKVRMCRASKHQSRNGLHAWQEATLDDIVGPNYVWHVKDLHKSVLVNDLKRFYGKAPAVLELHNFTGIENDMAKVSDFGISRSVPHEETHLTTLVQGIFGYLDPKYFHSGHFTEKSDVYSFVVVLVELFTGQKPISFIRLEEEKNLSMYFISPMKENRLFEVLEARVANEAGNEEIEVVAKRCLKLVGKKRPTMNVVVIQLETLREIQHQEVDCLLND
ncbi:hypothetical protein GIB67_004068 [Kingdonia uniflora]|uniref:Uncharacterized protein n=1 Tax=Kingdonia uniflora TaxID=39325 RepID=A0A7J7NR69_9MAGN|nr:hypothetical protein GIB67_004068 [Kingdonia uniflora]